MRILFCIPAKRISGPSIAALNIIKGLAKYGINIKIISSKPPKGIEHFFLEAEQAGANIIRVRAFKHSMLYWLSLIFGVLKSLRDSDIFHAHDLRVCAYTGLIAKIFRKPVILSLGGDPDIEIDLYKMKGWKKLKVKLLWWISRQITNYICTCSTWLASSIISKYSELAKKTIPIHNPIRIVEGIPFKRAKFQIVSVARLHYVKSLDTLIRAFSIVLRSFPRLKLIICGEGEERGKLEKLSSDLGISKNVTLAGFVPDPEKYVIESLALVLPSIYEPMGMVCLEAMAYGRPVIATKVGGIPEIVRDCETGLLVEPKNSEGLAKAIITLISNSRLRRKIRRKCKLWAKRFYPEAIAEKYLQIYEKVRRN